MIVRSIVGDDEIVRTLNACKTAVVAQLVQEGLLEQSAADKFLDTTICLFATRNGGLVEWMKRRLGSDGADDTIIVVKV